MSDSLDPQYWRYLVRRISEGKCTPILGDGTVATDGLRRADIAQKLAKEFKVPMIEGSGSNLPEIAQYVAVMQDDEMQPRDEVCKWITTSSQSLDVHTTTSIHHALAQLPIPVYITTGYDDLLLQTLRKVGKKPRRELCVWSTDISEKVGDVQQNSEVTPTPDEPVVYYLYGDAEETCSLVLTEDDHLRHLAQIASPQNEVFPFQVRRALADNILLFLGYQPTSLEFRTMFLGIVLATRNRRRNLAVQLPVESKEYESYLNRYFGKFAGINAAIYWGTVEAFAKELARNWEPYGET